MRPKYLKRTSRGKAYAGVKLVGKVHSLGIYDSPESLAKHERLVSEWRSGNLERQSFNVNDLVYADGYYRKAGEPTSEVHAVRAACQRLHDLYGDLTASKFGPRQFETVRDGRRNASRFMTWQSQLRFHCQSPICLHTSLKKARMQNDPAKKYANKIACRYFHFPMSASGSKKRTTRISGTESKRGNSSRIQIVFINVSEAAITKLNKRRFINLYCQSHVG